MTWMTMWSSEACESTLVTRTLHSEKSSSLMRSLMAYLLDQHLNGLVRGSAEETYPLSHTHGDLLGLVAGDEL